MLNKILIKILNLYMKFFYLCKNNKKLELKRIFLLNLFFVFLIIIIFPDSEKIYVTLTSWKGRINYIHKNLQLLLNNTIKPKKIILNLAIEEFPNKYLDLPKEIIFLSKENKNFQIFWVKKNNFVFKKLIPTINRYKKGLIISVDDDVLYPRNTFEKMINCYKSLGANKPVSFGTKSTDWKLNGKIIYSHFGAGSIVKYKYFNNKINQIYKETIEDYINKGIKYPDDPLYTYAALLNGYKYIRCKKYYIKLNNYISKKLMKPYENEYIHTYKKYHYLIKNYIKNKYNITIEKLIEKINK